MSEVYHGPLKKQERFYDSGTLFAIMAKSSFSARTVPAELDR